MSKINFQFGDNWIELNRLQGHGPGKQGPDVEDPHASRAHLQPL